VVAVVAMALDRSWDLGRLRRAAIVPAASALVAALTPVGPGIYAAMIAVNSRARFFSEWNSPTFNMLPTRALVVLLLIAIGLVLWHGQRAWLDLTLLLVAGVCAIWTWRTVPAAAMILVPLVAVQRATLRGATPVPGQLERLLLTVGGVATLAAVALVVPQTAADPPSQPTWVDPALSQLPAGTKVLDSWDWGGYLMWRYPQLDLLMHGYGDTFTVAELQRNTDISDMSPGWDQELRDTGCSYAVLRPTGLAYALEHQLHWVVLHRSPDIVELKAPAGWGS
jgi:hypothetical protein